MKIVGFILLAAIIAYAVYSVCALVSELKRKNNNSNTDKKND